MRLPPSRITRTLLTGTSLLATLWFVVPVVAQEDTRQRSASANFPFGNHTDREAGDADTDGDEELRSGSLDPLDGLHTVARTFSLRSRKRIRRLVGSLDLGATLYEFAKGDDPFRDRCLRSPP